MLSDTQKENKQQALNLKESQDTITQRGKAPKEIQADLLAGEPDDLTVDFTNIINYHGGGSN